MKENIKCLDCREYRPHQAFGLCSKCYHRHYKLAHPKRVTRSQKAWYEKNKASLKNKRKQYECDPERKARKQEWEKRNRQNQRFNGNRTLALIRDGYRCRICHEHQRLDVHHVDLDRNNHALWNLLTLCFLCHRKVHRKKNPLKIPQPILDSLKKCHTSNSG